MPEVGVEELAEPALRVAPSRNVTLTRDILQSMLWHVVANRHMRLWYCGIPKNGCKTCSLALVLVADVTFSVATTLGTEFLRFFDMRPVVPPIF